MSLITSRDGAPSPKGCVVNGQMTLHKRFSAGCSSSFMRLAEPPQGASRLVLAMSARSVKNLINIALSRHCRDAKVYDHTTTAMHDCMTIGCWRFTLFCWVGKHENMIMKPTNSPTHGQSNPRKKKVKCHVFPQQIIFFRVGIGFI